MDLHASDIIHVMHRSICIIHELFVASLASQHLSEYLSLLCGLRDESSHLHERVHTGSAKHWAKLLVIKFAPPNITLHMQITVLSKKAIRH